jgi:hypothetical protein
MKWDSPLLENARLPCNLETVAMQRPLSWHLLGISRVISNVILRSLDLITAARLHLLHLPTPVRPGLAHSFHLKSRANSQVVCVVGGAMEDAHNGKHEAFSVTVEGADTLAGAPFNSERLQAAISAQRCGGELPIANCAALRARRVPRTQRLPSRLLPRRVYRRQSQ